MARRAAIEDVSVRWVSRIPMHPCGDPCAAAPAPRFVCRSVGVSCKNQARIPTRLIGTLARWPRDVNAAPKVVLSAKQTAGTRVEPCVEPTINANESLDFFTATTCSWILNWVYRITNS